MNTYRMRRQMALMEQTDLTTLYIFQLLRQDPALVQRLWMLVSHALKRTSVWLHPKEAKRVKLFNICQ